MIWLARAVWLIAAVLAVLNLTLNTIFPGVYRAVDANEATGLALYATISLIGIGYATAGLLILRQRPRHAVGWMLLATGPLIIAEFTSALILAAVFTPIRKSIEAFVDRRFKPAAASHAEPSAAWDDPGFEAAVERIVSRVLDQRRGS